MPPRTATHPPARACTRRGMPRRRTCSRPLGTPGRSRRATDGRPCPLSTSGPRACPSEKTYVLPSDRWPWRAVPPRATKSRVTAPMCRRATTRPGNHRSRDRSTRSRARTHDWRKNKAPSLNPRPAMFLLHPVSWLTHGQPAMFLLRPVSGQAPDISLLRSRLIWTAR